MNLELATTLFVILIFICAEMYRIRAGVPGIIVSVEDNGIANLMSIQAVVSLRNGEHVRANINTCTACIGHLSIGDEIRLMKTRDGFQVHLPWIRTKKCSHTPFCSTRNIVNS